MHTNNTAPEAGFLGGLPEFLAALDRIYRLIGLEPDDARAATFADAEIFVPEPVESELAA